jgi:hypothetical protein
MEVCNSRPIFKWKLEGGRWMLEGGDWIKNKIIELLGSKLEGLKDFNTLL